MSAGDAIVIAGKRSAVAPRGGAFADLDVQDIAVPVVHALLRAVDLDPSHIDEIILGNALYGGGNPARLIALAAGVPDHVPALTIDRQCCSGLDAILLAARLIEAGAAHCVLAGGVESYSRSAIRMHRPRGKDEDPVAYDRPPFAPWPERDPDMIAAAATLAEMQRISRGRQSEWAVDSHANATSATRQGLHAAELVGIDRAPLSSDAFARTLTVPVAMRAPLLAGSPEYGVSSATTAVEADAAAMVLVVSPDMARRLGIGDGVRILDGATIGGAPELPGLAPIEACRLLLHRLSLEPLDFAAIELMEAFAAQAIACADALALPADRLNRGGGALARGHPIGASGVILMVRLFHELMRQPAQSKGLATIASAGGLASALAVARL